MYKIIYHEFAIGYLSQRDVQFGPKKGQIGVKIWDFLRSVFSRPTFWLTS